MNNKPKFRFAPSPNGFLHLGHAYSALLNFHYAKQMSGDFLLRIEDIDINRSKQTYIDAIYEDMAWLGLSWQKPVLLQSSNFHLYQNAAKQLHKQEMLYPCFCTRAQIAKNAQNIDPDGAPIYGGTCKSLNQKQIEEKLNLKIPVQWRLDMNKAIKKTGALEYLSAQPNPLTKPTPHPCKPMAWGDVVIIRKDTPTSYHLSVVVDDFLQKITHIVRGKDLEKSTYIHRILQNLLNYPMPIYTHHDLIFDENNLKLAKSIDSTSIKYLRNSGVSANKIAGKLGFNLLNLSKSP